MNFPFLEKTSLWEERCGFSVRRHFDNPGLFTTRRAWAPARSGGGGKAREANKREVLFPFWTLPRATHHRPSPGKRFLLGFHCSPCCCFVDPS